jgi:hypothetical protein
MSLLEDERWPDLAITGLQTLCGLVFGDVFSEQDAADISPQIGDYWYTPQDKSNAAALQDIIHYPTTYWENLYAAEKDRKQRPLAHEAEKPELEGEREREHEHQREQERERVHKREHEHNCESEGEDGRESEREQEQEHDPECNPGYDNERERDPERKIMHDRKMTAVRSAGLMSSSLNSPSLSDPPIHTTRVHMDVEGGSDRHHDVSFFTFFAFHFLSSFASHSLLLYSPIPS